MASPESVSASGQLDVTGFAPLSARRLPTSALVIAALVGTAFSLLFRQDA